ncbi:MAG: prepilin-type N-terminal cleavage/methylation domain-containing protein [Oceanicaulis sp.]|nr:prepilin-type N-terminal cleavage/methylation domain-containing protein [Oceanicaulis sp.]
MRPPSGRNRSGFTLVEALVAMLVAAAGFVAVYQIYANAARSERAASDVAHGVRLAEAFLAEARLDAGETLSGEMDGWRWRVTASPAPAPYDSQLVRLDAEALAPSGRRISLSVERAIADKDPQ